MEYAQCLEAVRVEKELLEKEWNKAVKAVKRKIEKIVTQDNPETNTITTHPKYELPLQPRQSEGSKDSQRREALRARAQSLLQSL